MPRPAVLDCYAISPPGLEPLTAAELAGLGIPAEVTEPGGAIGFRVTSRKSKLYHQDAIAERLAGVAARRVPGAHLSDAADTQDFVVRLVRDECTVKAPLRETLAAAMLLAVSWDGAAPLVDPLCGSGTIPIEAALLARRVPPGFGRRFALERWPAFGSALLRRAVARAEEGIRPSAPGPILGADRDAGAIEGAVNNATRAGVAGDITFRRAAISALEPPPAAGVIVTNPPYGVRVGGSRDLRDLYARLGQVLRRHCPRWSVAMLSARAELAGQTGLGLTAAYWTSNGGLRVGLLTGVVAPAA